MGENSTFPSALSLNQGASLSKMVFFLKIRVLRAPIGAYGITKGVWEVRNQDSVGTLVNKAYVPKHFYLKPRRTMSLLHTSPGAASVAHMPEALLARYFTLHC